MEDVYSAHESMHVLRSATKMDMSGSPVASLLHLMVKEALPYTTTDVKLVVFSKVSMVQPKNVEVESLTYTKRRRTSSL